MSMNEVFYKHVHDVRALGVKSVQCLEIETDTILSSSGKIGWELRFFVETF